MGELIPGDRRMLAKMRAAAPDGGRRLPLPHGSSFVDGSVHAHLKGGGYRGAFRVESGEDGQRVAVLLDFDSPSAWESGV